MFGVSPLHALAWLSMLGSTLATALPSNTSCRCFPGDKCWPSTAEWSAFNKTVSGKLIATVPIASVCHTGSSTGYDAAKCAQLQNDWLQPATHYSSSSSIMGQYFANSSCDPFTAPSEQCVIGTYVQYAVNAASVGDYQKTLAFAAARNIRFLVRNTGHDYFGKSTGAGALALWTHNIKDTSFVNYKSKAYTGKAMKVGAGVQVREALQAAHAQGLVVAGGQCQTVGVTGGYTQGGGHSLMASQIGLSADQVLEWEVVTAAGLRLVATPTQNTDLYWALSGGGGGTFGAVLSVTLRAYPEAKAAAGTFTVIKAMNPTISDAQFDAVVQTFFENMIPLIDNGGTALWTFMEGLLHVQPVMGPNMTVSTLRDLLSPTLNALNDAGFVYSSTFADYASFFDAWTAMNPEQLVTDGNAASYLLPRELVTTKAKSSELLVALKKLTTGTGVVTGGVAMNVGRGRSIIKPVANSVNPVWNNAFTYITFGMAYDRTNLSANTATWDLLTNTYAPILNNLVPGGLSSYLNEGNPFDTNFKKVFYGENYNKLLSIKDKYDPKGIFYGLTAVGSDRYKTAKDGRLCKV